MSSNIISVVGFSGKFARLVTTHLLSHPDVQIHGICRTASKIPTEIASNPRVTIFEASSTDKAGISAGIRGTSVCICCYLGDDALMIDGQKLLVDACIAEDVPRYIASDYTFETRGLKLGDHPNKDPMLHVQAYLREKERDTGGQIKGVHILCGAFMEAVWSFLGVVDSTNDVFRFWGTGDEVYEQMTYNDAAKYTAEVALDPAASGFLTFMGDRKSVKEMAKSYEEAYKTKPSLERLGSLDDLYKTMTAAHKEQPENLYGWMGMYYQYYMTNGSTYLGKPDNGRYPNVKVEYVKDFLMKHAKQDLGKSNIF